TRVLAGNTLPQTAPCDIVVQLTEEQRVLLSCTGGPIRDPEGEINGAIIIWRDVTQRRLLERQTSVSLRALVQIAQLLITNDGDDATDLKAFSQIVELIHQITNSYCVSITGIDETTEQLNLLVTYGMPPAAEAYWHEQREGVTLETHFGAA